MKRLTLVGLLINLSLLACSKVENEPYSQALVNNFINACVVTSGGQSNSCTCIINELPKYLSQKEYIKLEASYVASGQLPDKMADAMDKAMRSCSNPSK